MNILYRRSSQLDHIFQPKTVAVIGATENEGSVGRTVMQNLLNTSFGGEVIPVNPKRPSVLGIEAYPDLKSIPKKVAKEEKVKRIYAQMLDENFQMQKLCKHFGFTLKPEGKFIYAEKHNG